MKGVIVIFAVLIFGCLVASQSHNYQWGVREPREVLVNRTIAVRSGTILQVKTIDLVYPISGQQGRNISAIVVLDQYINGNGGYASLYAGGIGYNYTTVHLQSQRGHGYNFIVEIYAKP
ncbi:probable salivary secreted peptide [Anopheles cruzii]|uniref:probable salivary secreted peptide n=1 Tax=Anopheles cruzii TaxID=68878 RepID=UPI0022EC5E09|nr:probable salivary secreted peptide [Anopheles cruzii]